MILRMKLGIIVVICILIGGFFSIVTDLPETASAYTPHPPILIEGNDNFTVANGVTGGNGKPFDPYIIEGWEINASTAYGIEIRNTDAHFLIRDVSVHSGGMSYDGIYLYNITNGALENATLLGNWNGILLHSCNNTTAIANSFSDNWQGISLSSSANITVVGNNFTGNREGVSIWFSYGLNVTSNNFSLNRADAIHLRYSNKISINGNNILSNSAGIRLGDSTNTTIFDNNISSNDWYGVLIGSSTYTNIGRNTLVSDGVNVLGPNLAHYNTNTITSDNLVNGKPLYYYRDCDSVNIDGIPAGQLIVANCTNFRAANLETVDTDIGINMAFVNNATIEGNNVSRNNFWYGIWLYLAMNITVTYNEIAFNSGHGISVHSATGLIANNEITSNKRDGLSIGYSNNITITHNNVSNSGTGINIYGSRNITVAKNTVSQNVWGVWVSSSTDNRVYHNSFIDNGNQSSDDSPNLWDNGYPSGGNYWSDYTGPDQCSGPNQDICPDPDGIGDIPYIIDADSQDRYPFLSPLGTGLPRPPAILYAILSGKNMENVTIAWSLSLDDGEGSKSVVGYKIYRNTTYDPRGLGYRPVASLSNGTSEFVDVLAGEGNSNDYFYKVCAVDQYNRTICDENQAAKFTRPLSKGPNLVSIPLLQSNETIETVFQTVQWDKSWSYDSSNRKWKQNMEFKPYLGGLDQLNHTMGLWVNVTTGSNLTVAGIVPTQTVIRLHAGWNLASFPSFANYTVGELRTDVNAIRVEGIDPVAEPYHLKVLSDVDSLQTGYGYWVWVENDILWTVSN